MYNVKTHKQLRATQFGPLSTKQNTATATKVSCASITCAILYEIWQKRHHLTATDAANRTSLLRSPIALGRHRNI